MVSFGIWLNICKHACQYSSTLGQTKIVIEKLKMTVEKIKEVRFMKCATMLRKQYGAKISHVYCEVDDTKDRSRMRNSSKFSMVQRLFLNIWKVHTITEAYEIALQIGSEFIKRGHVSMNSAVFGRLDFPSEICFVSLSLSYRSKHIFNRKGSDWNSAVKASHYVGLDCVSFLGTILNGTPGC